MQLKMSDYWGCVVSCRAAEAIDPKTVRPSPVGTGSVQFKRTRCLHATALTLTPVLYILSQCLSTFCIRVHPTSKRPCAQPVRCVTSSCLLKPHPIRHPPLVLLLCTLPHTYALPTVAPVTNCPPGQVRERDWANVVTAHEGDPAAYTWRLAHFTLGDHVLVPPEEVRSGTGVAGSEECRLGRSTCLAAWTCCGALGTLPGAGAAAGCAEEPGAAGLLRLAARPLTN